MKITFIYDLAYPFSKGGAEKRIYDFANCLSRHHDVEIVSSKFWIGKNICILNKVRHIGITEKNNLYDKNGKRKVLSSFFFGLKTFIFVLKTDADVLDFEVFPYFPIIFVKIALFFKRKKPKIISNWCECLGKNGWKKYSRNFWFVGLSLEKLAKLNCDSYIAISEFTKKRMEKNLGIDGKKISVIHPCIIDHERIKKINDPKEKKYGIVYFGRLISHKHVEKIIELSSRLKEDGIKTKTLIVGNGSEESNLKKMVNDLNFTKDIFFLDFIDDYDKLIGKIKSAKIMVFPSEREGFGIAVLEANACGLPVLVIDYPENAAKTLIEDEKNGFICHDDDQLFCKVKMLLSSSNADLLKQMSRLSIEMSRKFDMTLSEKEIINYYQNEKRDNYC
jgi:L-malate glycosyltransferase